jgi:hypothetical protein
MIVAKLATATTARAVLILMATPSQKQFLTPGLYERVIVAIAGGEALGEG